MEKQLNYFAEDINEILGSAVIDCNWVNNALYFETKTGNFAATIPTATNTGAGLMSASVFGEVKTATEGVKAVNDRIDNLPKIPVEAATSTTGERVTIGFYNDENLLFSAALPIASETMAGVISADTYNRLSHVAEIYEALPLNHITKEDEIIVTPTGTKGKLGIDTYDGHLFLFISGRYTTKWTASQNVYGLSSDDFKRTNVLINANGILYAFNKTIFVN